MNRGYESFEVRLTGVAPLLMHNVRKLADPMSDISRAKKRLTLKKTAKTDDDMMELQRLDMVGSLYLGADGKLTIPGENIDAMICDMAKKYKKGKLIKSSVFCTTLEFSFAGEQDPEKLVLDPKHRFFSMVRIKMARQMSVRPIFRSWSLKFRVDYLPGDLNREDIESFIKEAGLLVGLGDWRPRYGTFTTEILG